MSAARSPNLGTMNWRNSFDFISAASRFATPGVSAEDAEDLYRVMQGVRAQHPRVGIKHDAVATVANGMRSNLHAATVGLAHGGF